jgi:hypothetical protein
VDDIGESEHFVDMYRIIAAFTAGCYALAPQQTLASTQSVEVHALERGSGVDEDGRRMTYQRWVEDGVAHGDARIEELDGDYLEFWREGDVIAYEGFLDGKAVSGESTVGANSESLCAGWIALVCIGLAILAGSGGCANFEGCVPVPQPKPPGGQGEPPDDSGESESDDGEDDTDDPD